MGVIQRSKCREENACKQLRASGKQLRTSGERREADSVEKSSKRRGKRKKKKKDQNTEPSGTENCSMPLVHRNLNLISRKKEKIERFEVQGMRMRR